MEQSSFSQNQEVLMPPPEVEAKRHEIKVVTVKKKLPVGIIIGGGFFILLILVIGVMMIINSRRIPVETIAPTPTPKPLVQPSTKESEWQRIRTIIDGANPETNGIIPPVTEMKIEF